MRVLHVAESAKGGVGSYLAYTLPHQLSVLGPENLRLIVPEQHREQVGPLPTGVARCYDRRGRTAASVKELTATLVSEASAFRPDVIHAHSTFAGLVVRALFAAWPQRPAVVYCAHGWAFNVEAAPWKRRAVAALERVMSRWCDRIVAISAHEADEARRIGIAPERVRLVSSGIPDGCERETQTWDDPRLKVLFIGRLDRQKGADILLDAVRSLQDRITVRVAGACVSEGLNLARPPNVEFLGWLDPARIAGQLEAADVLAAPSRWEGFGLAAAEAMRAGKPVVASRVGGLCELVEHGATGRLAEPGSPTALASALLADDAERRRAMGARGRTRYLQYFDARVMNEGLLSVYRDACRRSARRRDEVPAFLPTPQEG